MRSSLGNLFVVLLLLGGGAEVFADMLPDAYLATHEVVPAAITWTVTKTADTNDGVCDADCSLREAIAAAASGDTIVFSSLFNSPQTITLTLGQIAITQNLTINGTGSDLLSISGNNAGRIFDISGGVTITMTGMKLRDGNLGNAIPGRGGGIQVAGGILNLTNMEVSNNRAGGVGNDYDLGGGIYGTNCTLKFINVNFDHNTGLGGSVFAESGTINISDSIVSNNNPGGMAADTVKMSNTTVSGNSIYGINGRHLTVTDSRIIGNERGIAGGDSASTLTVERSIITGNTNGGLSNSGFAIVSNTLITNNHINAEGGGLTNTNVMYIINSAILGNTSGQNGGGIRSSSGNLFITNSTVSGNVAGNSLSSGFGGGIYGEVDGTNNIVLINSTISNNRTSGAGGGVRQDPGGTMTIRNTIIAGNTSLFASEADVSGTIVSQGNNLIGNTTGSSGWVAADLLNVNPMLGPLADNGGGTMTHALLNGSPAINAGNNSLAVDPQAQMPLTGDQRGFERFAGGIVDIGAYEAMAAAPPVISGSVTYGNAIGAPAQRFVSNVLISGAGSTNVSTTSISNGSYSLSGFATGSYTVTPSKTGGVNGITSFDAARIAQHVAGLNVLTGNQLIVADVSGNGTISSFDAAEIARYSAGLNNFGSTGNWIFMPASRMYPSVSSNLVGEDFVALLMGEVSGNWMDSGAGRNPMR